MKAWEGCLRARKVLNVVSTDDILPARYKHSYTDPVVLAPHVFENKMPGFAETLRSGDVIVSEDTFGIGSSREQAVSALLATGVVAVLAPSFGRIFFRNAWNLGLLALEIKGFALEDGDPIKINLEKGEVSGPAGLVRCASVPPELIAIVTEGGLLEHLRRQMISLD